MVTASERAARVRLLLFDVDGVLTDGTTSIDGAGNEAMRFHIRDGLGIVAQASETEALARQASSTRGVYLVPAFTGLGAPHWDANARGASVGSHVDFGDRGAEAKPSW